MEKNTEDNSTESLKDRRFRMKKALAEIENSKMRSKKLSVLYFVIGVICIIVTALLRNLYIRKFNEDNYILTFISFAAGIMILMVAIIYIILNFAKDPRILILEENLRSMDDEIELNEIAVEEYEKRAEVQFRNHQKELKRYYDINLGHLKCVFPVGIITMIVGIGIIVLSIIIFKNSAYPNIAPILIGTISGILIDFIGAIFIKMYIETIKASTEFHNKLIHSNDNLFANVLITKISNEDLKNETFAEVAKIISRDKVEDSKKTENN